MRLARTRHLLCQYPVPSFGRVRLLGTSRTGPSSEPNVRKPRVILRWAVGIGLAYGTFSVLSKHYSSERHFGRIRAHIKTFAREKLKPKWKSVGDIEESLADSEDDSAYSPPVVDVTDVIETQSASQPTGWSSPLNFLKSPISFNVLSESLQSWEWPASLAKLQYQLNALLLELGRGEGSLWSEVVNGTPDTELHPEVQWDAQVRLGDELCFSEKAFLRERKRKMLQAFAKLLEVPVETLDERDLPVVAIAASGGGFRAMCNTSGALRAAQKTGILDVVTYVSAISGSCWSLGALYSGVSGSFAPQDVAEYLRRRVQLPYLGSSILDMLITKPTNKYLLTGLIQKAVGPHGSISLVDIYGTLISTRLFCPEDVTHLNPRHLSLSNFRLPVDTGSLPMPIFTAISRHTPHQQPSSTSQELVVDESRAAILAQEKADSSAQRGSWLWYEFSPYEVGCDELGAWIPTWALGREFNRGKNVQRTPELSFTILAGIYASAFCASLQLYYQEVKPILKQLPGAIFSWISDIVNARETQFDAMHPVPPDELPNFVRGLDGLLKEGSPAGIGDRETIGLMDAGAELNIPYYPLLRRGVDCIIALDASADSQDLWFTRAESYAMKKGLRLWPRGVKWPKEIMRKASASSLPSSTETASAKLAEAAETEVATQAEKQRDSDERNTPSQQQAEVGDQSQSSEARASAYVWIGSSKEDEAAATPIHTFDEETLALRDGIGIVYMPILANDEAVPGLDPYDVSTWRFEMSMEESGKLMDLAEYNFISGEAKVKAILKAMWIRKRRARLEKEHQHRLGFLKFGNPH